MTQGLRLVLLLVLIHQTFLSQAQSLELMPGTERVFVDAQWLEFLDSSGKWSLFSRSRATSDYEENTNLFTGGYLNLTTKSGLGASVVGRISSSGSGGDIGAHYFKAGKNVMLYALASVAISDVLSYSWFSILRVTPELSSYWELYSSLELFSNFERSDHVISVQRMRLGLSRDNYQFGLGLNLTEFGNDFNNSDVNPGIFIRKQF